MVCITDVSELLWVGICSFLTFVEMLPLRLAMRTVALRGAGGGGHFNFGVAFFVGFKRVSAWVGLSRGVSVRDVAVLRVINRITTASNDFWREHSRLPLINRAEEMGDNVDEAIPIKGKGKGKGKDKGIRRQ